MLKKLFFTLLLFLPQAALASNEIILHLQSESPTESTYTLEAKDLKHSLIGISATIKLAPGIKMLKFAPGNYFEGKDSNVTYLVAPKKTNNQEVILGIANLGTIGNKKSGTIISLVLSHSPHTKSVLALENTIASGNENGNRTDYHDISWKLDTANLPQSGSDILLPLIVSFLISLFITILKNYLKN